MTPDVLDLNQQQALACRTPGPLLVIAGAGTGKTLTIAARLARLICDGADPQRLLLLAFSRRAAAVLERRAATAAAGALGLGPNLPALPWCGTFHGVAARLLRLHARAAGLPEDFTVLDRADAEDLMALVRQDLALDRSAERFPLAPTCLTLLSAAVNCRRPLADVIAERQPWCAAHEQALAGLFRAYTAAKQRQHLLDFDDLLLYWHLALGDPALGPVLRARFDEVLVDEFQDVNALQADIVGRLRPTGEGLCVVGDDAQAIYRFRGASVEAILGFPRGFDPPAVVVALEHNYRSTRPILDAANAVIAQADRGWPKRLWTLRESSAPPRLVTLADEAAEAAWIAGEVLRQRENGVALRRQAVLFRTASHSAALELELARRRIPFVKYGGLQFVESAHVKDLLALLRWARNPRCLLAGARAARLVPGVGAAAARALSQAVAAAAEPWTEFDAFRPPNRARREWADFARVMASLREGGWPAALQTAGDWYRPQLARLYDSPAARAADLTQLAHIAAGYPSLERFVTEVALDPPAASSGEAADPSLDEDYLILSTIHSAKGLEWNAVIVMRAVDGCIPSDMSTGNVAEIEEERRLLYVAMTRARDELTLTLPQRFHVTQQPKFGDRHLHAIRTRFIPESIEHLFDCVAPAAPQEVTADPGGPVADLAAQAREMWPRAAWSG